MAKRFSAPAPAKKCGPQLLLDGKSKVLVYHDWIGTLMEEGVEVSAIRFDSAPDSGGLEGRTLYIPNQYWKPLKS